MRFNPRDLTNSAPTTAELQSIGLSEQRAGAIIQAVTACEQLPTTEERWQKLTQVLCPADPFELHLWLYECIYLEHDRREGPPPAWIPDRIICDRANVTRLARSKGLDGFDSVYEWSISDREGFWKTVVQEIGVLFADTPSSISYATSDPNGWLPQRQLNIAASCLQGPPDKTAVICRDETGGEKRTSYAELITLSNRVANGLVAQGLRQGDRVGMILPMTANAVAAYLGTILAGCVPVSIAESFATPEIEVRLKLSEATAVFVADVVRRGGRRLPCYEKLRDSDASAIAIVIPADEDLTIRLSARDTSWSQFLSDDTGFTPRTSDAGDEINILFSSGTTGEPKAIPWTHSTPLKCAADARYHHNIHADSVVAWPTSLGWMMGPWLIFSGLLNRATIALFDGAPNTRSFCEFVQDVRVTMLGVIPSLVRAWRQGSLTEGCDWTAIEAFSSTGECSNAEDMLYLMSQAGYRPVIEYCGGTEIGGGYITGTLVHPCRPGCFSTPALGIDLVIADEHVTAESGEVLINGPSIGLSQSLLNADHEEVYFHDVPVIEGHHRLRRHGDEIERLAQGVYRAGGRTDDAMNLGGIKVSAVELERCLNHVEHVIECAAVACPASQGGPAELTVVAVLDDTSTTPESTRKTMQKAISTQMNPLFRVQRVLLIEQLPRTASNKIMRRKLREFVIAEARQSQTP